MAGIGRLSALICACKVLQSSEPCDAASTRAVEKVATPGGHHVVGKDKSIT